MARRTEVTLSQDQRPVFPDRCASCGAAHPEFTDRASTAAKALFWNVLDLALASSSRSSSMVDWVNADVPLCKKCRDPARRQRRVRDLVLCVSLIVLLVAPGDIYGWYRLPIGGWPLIGITVACLVSSLVWGHYSPPPLELTAESRAVTYEFRNADYAREFAALNEPFREENDPASPGRAATPLPPGEGPGIDAVRGGLGGRPDPERGGRGSVPPPGPEQTEPSPRPVE